MRNVGTPDRLIRLIVGALLVLAPFLIASPLWAESWAVWASVLIGIVLAGTAVFGFCPIYAALRLSTNRNKGDAR
jgi:hypothetical protein